MTLSTIHSHVIPQAIKEKHYTWTMNHLTAFDELLISWNTQRPSKGHYVILSRLLIHNEWSPWLLYAVWGTQYQYSFHDTTPKASVRSYQDQVEVLDGKVATGFSIRIEACSGANLNSFFALNACTSKLKTSWPIHDSNRNDSFFLQVPNISQLCLNHPRCRSFCSPTSVTAVMQYLCIHQQTQPLLFANQVYDAGFNIYGNWAFNIAQAFVELGLLGKCFCARVADMNWLWQSLKQGLPVVVSVKGQLPNTFLPYTNGHLLVIKGFNAVTKQFLCMDPAFPSDAQTEIAYPWKAFMQAWANRYYLAYFFFPWKRSIYSESSCTHPNRMKLDFS